jgi:membrane-bound lytic murein transglycosylase B
MPGERWRSGSKIETHVRPCFLPYASAASALRRVAVAAVEAGATFRQQLGRGGPYAPKHYLSKFLPKFAGQEKVDQQATAAGLAPAGGGRGIPALTLRAYREAAAWAAGYDPGCRLSWTVLAGIGRIESNHGLFGGPATRFSPSGAVSPRITGPPLDGRGVAAIPDSDGGRWDGDTTWDRAVGPMQFIPTTWRSLGRDGNGDGVADPNNLFDAAVGAAGYLGHGAHHPRRQDDAAGAQLELAPGEPPAPRRKHGWKGFVPVSKVATTTGSGSPATTT